MLDPRNWFRSTSDQRLQEWIGACIGAAVFGVVCMAVVLPHVDRSPFTALPWTVIWSAVGFLAWRERRRRAVAG